MYELALREWGVTPEYVNLHWTEEILAMLFRSRHLSYKQQAATRPNQDEPGPEPIHRHMRCDTFMAKHGFTVQKA